MRTSSAAVTVATMALLAACANAPLVGPDGAADAGSDGFVGDVEDVGRMDVSVDTAPQLPALAGVPLSAPPIDTPRLVHWPQATTWRRDEVLPPRLIAPLSGWEVNTQRPTLRWSLPSGLRRARVEICRDRGCTMEQRRVEVTGERYRVEPALAPGVIFWRVRGLDEGGAVRWTSATWETGIPHRDNGGDYILGRLRDHDGDGLDDLVLGGGGFDIFYGHRTEFGARRVTLDQDPNQIVETRLFHYPQSVHWSDLNADGRSDLLINYFYLTYDPMVDDDVRSFWGFFQLLGSTVSPSLWSLQRLPFEWRSRDDVSSQDACDVNGDGLPEILGSGGRVFTVLTSSSSSGRSRVTWLGDQDSEGGEVFCVGDVTGDGYGDVIVRRSSRNQRTWDGEPIVWLAALPGGPGGVSPLHSLYIRSQRDAVDEIPSFGLALAVAGDWDNDGRTDLVVGSNSYIFLYSGSYLGLRGDPQRIDAVDDHDGSRGNAFGQSTAVGDFNGDGWPDIVTSHPCAPATVSGGSRRCSNGRVYVYYGREGFYHGVPSLTLQPSEMGAISDSLGIQIQGALDINGDGYDDLVISSRRTAGTPVFLGGSSGLMDQPSFLVGPWFNGGRGLGRILAVESSRAMVGGTHGS